MTIRSNMAATYNTLIASGLKIESVWGDDVNENLDDKVSKSTLGASADPQIINTGIEIVTGKTIKTNVINETTSDNGIRVDGLLIKDNFPAYQLVQIKSDEFETADGGGSPALTFETGTDTSGTLWTLDDTEIIRSKEVFVMPPNCNRVTVRARTHNISGSSTYQFQYSYNSTTKNNWGSAEGGGGAGWKYPDTVLTALSAGDYLRVMILCGGTTSPVLGIIGGMQLLFYSV